MELGQRSEHLGEGLEFGRAELLRVTTHLHWLRGRGGRLKLKRNKWENKITFLVLTVQTKVVQTVSVLLFLRLVPEFVAWKFL